MAFQVLVTEIANEDLAGLVRYIARDNPAAAERFGLALLGKLKLLREHPLLGRIVPERASRICARSFIISIASFIACASASKWSRYCASGTVRVAKLKSTNE